MKVAFGIKAHSGWAVLVVLGKRDDDFVVFDRRRVELVEEDWARQPYHAAQGLKPDAARDLVSRGIEAAHRIAIREIREAVKREEQRENKVTACAVLVSDPMPDWGLEEILRVHFRLHKAEGVLFRDALAAAAGTAGLKLVAISQEELTKYAEGALGTPARGVANRIAALGKAVGPPWGKDQKDAALAALVALLK